MQNVVWALFRGDFERPSGSPSARARRRGAQRGRRLLLPAGDVPAAPRAGPARRDRGADARGGRGVSGLPLVPLLIPLLDLELGRAAEARRGLDALAQDGFAALPRDCEWLFCLCVLAEVASGLGDREAAEVLYELLALPAVSAMAAGEVLLGPVVRFLGILAATERACGRRGRAPRGRARVDARIGAVPGSPTPKRTTPACCASAARPGDERGRANCSRRAARPTGSSASRAQRG